VRPIFCQPLLIDFSLDPVECDCSRPQELRFEIDARKLDRFFKGEGKPKSEEVGGGSGGASGGKPADRKRKRPVSDDAAAPQKFERIIFNFPHTGQQMAHVNRAMIRNFFASAVGLLDNETSEIHVTLKLKFPYTSWDTETSATAAGLVLTDTLDFDAAVFPGYTHRTTRKDATAAGVKDKDKRHCKTFVYRKDPSGVCCNILLCNMLVGRPFRRPLHASSLPQAVAC
jgi:hypothetical protein